MLTTGALSITQRPQCPEGDLRTLQVRARRVEWLDEFRTRYCPELGESFHIEGTDYQWRAHATPEEVATALARAALSIDYPNFKNATMDPAHGLPDAALRYRLHDAYSACWSVLRNAGDGTSVYDKKWTTAGQRLTGIVACRKWGHYWPAGRKTCVDCPAPNPSYPEAGPGGVYPPKNAAGKKKPRKLTGGKKP